MCDVPRVTEPPLPQGALFLFWIMIVLLPLLRFCASRLAVFSYLTLFMLHAFALFTIVQDITVYAMCDILRYDRLL